jgi:tetratricopeptide (TPR) repeat protein
LAVPPAGACSSMAPELTRADGQPLRSVEDAGRDAGLVADGEVIGIGTEKICAPPDSNNCRDFPRTLIFRIDRSYKGALDPVIEVEPLGGCASDGSGGVDNGLVPIGTRMLLTAEIMPDRMELFPSTARYLQTADFVSLENSFLMGVPVSEWERYRRLWLDLEAHAAKRPDDPERWRDLARAMEEWRDYPRALKAYDRLAALLPRDLDIQASRGRMLFYLRMPEAEAVLSRVVAENPADPKSRSLLAIQRYELGVTSSLTGLDLSNTDLRGRSFKDVDFSRSDLSGADLRGNTEFIEVNLAETDLSAARFFDGYPLYNRIYPTSLRNADFTSSTFEDIPLAGDSSGIKLSGVTLPIRAFSNQDLAFVTQADLTGARIGCTALADAEWWRKTSLSSEELGYRRDRWQDHLDELKQAQRVVKEHPGALLDASCSEAIQNHVHENCAPWIAKADRSPACKIDF